MHAASHLVGAWPMTRYLLALCLIFAAPAFAATWKDGGGWASPPMTQGSDGVYTVLPDMTSPNNSHVTTCTPSSCNRSGDLPAPRGRGAPRLTPTATFPKPNIAFAAVALGGRVLPWLAVGKGLYDWYRAANLNPDESSPSGFSEDVGGSSAVAGYWAFNSNPAQRFGTSSAACDFALSEWVKAYSTGTNVIVSQANSVTVVNSNRVNCPTTVTYKASPTATVTSTAQNTYTINRTLGGGLCADNATQLVSADGIGGVCPGPVKTPLTDIQLAERLNNANVSSAALSKALEEILKAGGAIQDTGTHSVIGPSSVPGETKTKTTTAANGTTQVTTVTNNYNYNYAGNTITITTTELVQNADGSTEETTSDTPDPLCAQNPNSLACIKLGDVPTDQPGWETKTIAYQADSLGLPAACPAPWTGQLRGWTLSFSYQPACDVAPQVRLAILALTTLAALLMIITTVRT